MSDDDALITRLRDRDKRGWDDHDKAAARIAALTQRIDGYQGSRDHAINLLAKALGIEPDKMRAVEYYAQQASDRIAALIAERSYWKASAEQEEQRATKAEAERENDARQADENIAGWTRACAKAEAERDLAASTFAYQKGKIESLQEELAQQRKTFLLAVARADRAEAERDALRTGYAECLEDLQCWAAYAGEYFQKKHDLAGDIARHSAALAKGKP